MKNFKPNIKNILIVCFVLLISALTIASCKAILPKANLKPSDYDLGVRYEQAKNEDKPMLAVFYVDWCTYCKRFMPRLDKVRNLNKDDFNVVLINVENPENAKLVEEYRISGYPSVYIIDPKYDNRVHNDNAFFDTVSDLNKEVNRYSNFRKLVKKGESCKQN